MLRMKKVLKGIIRGLDHIVNFIALSLILAAMFLSGYMLWDSHQVYQTADAKNYEAYIPTEKNTKSFEELQKINPDVCAWLTVDGTKIDYPIMQTKGNPQYYLRRDFNKQYSYLGTPFMDSRCDMNYDNNLIVYGHNMRDGKMFADLLKYRDKKYLESHNIINFITQNEVQKYEVAAVCKVRSDDEWYSYTCQTDKESFNDLISHIKDRSLYQTDKSVEYGDYFLTLSTCEYSQKDGRLIVIAVRI